MCCLILKVDTKSIFGIGQYWERTKLLERKIKCCQIGCKTATPTIFSGQMLKTIFNSVDWRQNAGLKYKKKKQKRKAFRLEGSQLLK